MNTPGNPNAMLPYIRFMHFYPGNEWRCRVCGTVSKSLRMVSLKVGLCEACSTISHRFVIHRGGQGKVLSGVNKAA